VTLTTRSKNNGTIAITAERVADILERELDHLIHDWMLLVEKQQDLIAVSLTYEERTGHLPKLLRDVIVRLRLDAGTKAPLSIAATRHAELRREQGYSVAMVVEESRLLQVSIFSTLHRNTHHLDYIKLLPDVVTIADEVDAQLKQQMLHYMEANAIGTKPHTQSAK
jgi:hypothetical protein